MTGLPNADGFKICIQVCVWPGFRPLCFAKLHENSIKMKSLDGDGGHASLSPLQSANHIVSLQKRSFIDLIDLPVYSKN